MRRGKGILEVGDSEEKKNVEKEYVEDRRNLKRKLIILAFGSGGYSVGSGKAVRKLSGFSGQ